MSHSRCGCEKLYAVSKCEHNHQPSSIGPNPSSSSSSSSSSGSGSKGLFSPTAAMSTPQSRRWQDILMNLPLVEWGEEYGKVMTQEFQNSQKKKLRLSRKHHPLPKLLICAAYTKTNKLTVKPRNYGSSCASGGLNSLQKSVVCGCWRYKNLKNLCRVQFGYRIFVRNLGSHWHPAITSCLAVSWCSHSFLCFRRPSRLHQRNWLQCSKLSREFATNGEGKS